MARPVNDTFNESLFDSSDLLDLTPQELQLMQLEEYLDGQLDTAAAGELEAQLRQDTTLASTFQQLQKDRSVRRAVFASSEMNSAVDAIFAQSIISKTRADAMKNPSRRTAKANPFLSLRWGSALAACLALGLFGGAWWQNQNVGPAGVPGEIIGSLQFPVGGSQNGITSVNDGSYSSTELPRQLQANCINFVVLDARGNFLDRVQLNNQDELIRFAQSHGIDQVSVMLDGQADTGSPIDRKLTLVGVKR
jgi:hypothetical protein